MRFRGAIITLTILVTLISVYQVHFTFVARNIEQEAARKSMKDGKVVDSLKEKYLSKLSKEKTPVYNLLGAKYTYPKLKETELALGLDLQGGINVTLEVSAVELLQVLADSRKTDPGFVNALTNAIARKGNSASRLTDLFVEEFKKAEGDGKLNRIFVNPTTENKNINPSSSDGEILAMLNREMDESIERSFKILRDRIDRFGVVQPNIQKIEGTGRIQVELPGVQDKARVLELLKKTAKLEFLEVDEPQNTQKLLTTINDRVLALRKVGDKTAPKGNDSLVTKPVVKEENALFEDTLKAKSDSSTAKADSVKKPEADTAKNQVSEIFSLATGRKGENAIYYKVEDTARINDILNMAEIREEIGRDQALIWSISATSLAEKGKKEYLELVHVKRTDGEPLLAGDAVTDAYPTQDMRVLGSNYQISMSMDALGSEAWGQITARLINKRVAIVLDNFCYSAPYIRQAITGGQSSISGAFTLEEASDLANILKAGKLPAPVSIVQIEQVGPTLGIESIKAGLWSTLAGLVIVVIFMILYYNKPGSVADIALVFNLIFILGMLASLNTVLTLPGIAGMVLTIGMAVDANVLIFERIKDELRNGKTLRQAIDLGYDKAFSSIFDSNITTILTGIILFALGSGPIKGFAVTLIIGILTSFFTSVYVSKVIILWMVRNKDEKSVSFTTVISRNLFQNLNFNIIGKRKIAYVVSSLLIILGFVTIFMQGGLNLGVDFKGGRSYVVKLDKALPASQVKSALGNNFVNSSTEVKTFGSDDRLKITTSFMIDDESTDADAKVQATLQKGMDELAGQGKYIIEYSNKVGATIADDIQSSSILSLVLALVGIFAYVLIRFRNWRFSLGGVVALFHDSLMVIAIFSIMRLFGIAYEIDQVFVAAILTIVGFSINDTVIVFDRVREVLGGRSKLGLGSYEKKQLGEMLNQAINFTLSRTIMTTFTVLMVVLVLFMFGGESLRGFSFALLIGVVFGSYSTIFIAVPLVLDLWRKDNKGTSSATEKTSEKKVSLTK